MKPLLLPSFTSHIRWNLGAVLTALLSLCLGYSSHTQSNIHISRESPGRLKDSTYVFLKQKSQISSLTWPSNNKRDSLRAKSNKTESKSSSHALLGNLWTISTSSNENVSVRGPLIRNSFASQLNVFRRIGFRFFASILRPVCPCANTDDPVRCQAQFY